MTDGNLINDLVSVFGASQVYIVDDHGIRTAESHEERISRVVREQHQEAIRWFCNSIMASWCHLREAHGDTPAAWLDSFHWPRADWPHCENLGGAYRITDDGRVVFDGETAIRLARERVNSISKAWWERLDSLLDRRYSTGHHKRGFLDATVTAQIGAHAVMVRVRHTLHWRAHELVHRYPAHITIDGKRGTIKQLKALQATTANAPSV